MIPQRALAFAIVFALVGCAAIEPKTDDLDLESFELSGRDDAADAFTRRLRIDGALRIPQRVVGHYASGRTYAGYVFTGRAGDGVVLDATAGGTSDPVMLVYGPERARGWSSSRPIAWNDDFHGTRDAHVELTLPGDGTYLVVVLEYWGRSGAFTLTLGCTGESCGLECGADDACPTGAACERVYCVRAPCPSFCQAVDPATTCEVDADCTAIPAGCCGCSMGGEDIAINAAYADARRPVCADVFCPAVYLCRDERPACVAGRCEMAPAAPAACTPDECGPMPRVATLLCDDGSVGGLTGECNRDESGACGWEVRPCPEGGATICGGFRRGGVTECAEGEFCDYALEATCGWADATGVCRVRPDVCTREYVPVCGCDGVTYANRCNAHAAGVAVQAEGPCAR